jgi:superfamily II DNA/RNA helicase
MSTLRVEADEMLDLGFPEDLEAILRSITLFHATPRPPIRVS